MFGDHRSTVTMGRKAVFYRGSKPTCRPLKPRDGDRSVCLANRVALVLAWSKRVKVRIDPPVKTRLGGVHRGPNIEVRAGGAVDY